MSNLLKSRLFQLGFLVAFLIVLQTQLIDAQCPTLNTNVNFNTTGCAPSMTPCHLCPGATVTLQPTGTNLPGGGCIDWYYGTSNNFNPYNGQGTYLGCSQIDAPPPPTPCSPAPLNLFLFAHACGSAGGPPPPYEAADDKNEFMAVWSGGGFNVDDLTVELPAGNNTGDPANANPGSAACPWMMPTAFAVSSVESFCPTATVVPVGPGDAIPPNVPVIIFMSSSLDFNYNWGSLCPLSPTIYVMQNSCQRERGAFTNNGGSPTPKDINLNYGGCSDLTTYLPPLLPAGQGSFVTDFGFPPLYFNLGCGFPPLPPNWTPPPPPPPPVPDPYTMTITDDMCNGGPYWVVGVVDPLNGACPDVFTNYMPFNVVCPDPDLLPGTACSNGSNLDLNTLEDPAFPNGTWSGPGVSGTSFDPTGQSGTVTVEFTPTAPCATPKETTITVSPPPGAFFNPVPPVCAGEQATISINLNGDGPWNFQIFANGAPMPPVTTNSNPYTFAVTPSTTTTYSLQNFSDSNCSGPNEDVTVDVLDPASADLELSGSGNICPGENALLTVNFSGGAAPYTFIYSINGVDQAPITTNDNPYQLNVSPSDDAQYELVSVQASGCDGTASGTAFVTVGSIGDGELISGSTTACENETAVLTFNFNGPPPFTFVYSVNGTNMPAITTSQSTYNLTVSPDLGDNAYELVSLEVGGCDGDVTGSFNVTVEPPADGTLSGDETLCGGGSAQITFESSGNGPFVYTFTANGVPQPPITTNVTPFNFTVNPTLPTTYVLTNIEADGCPGIPGGTATVDFAPPITASLSGGGQVCPNGDIDLTINFVGNGPFTFVYSANGVNQAPITTDDNPFTLTVSPGAATLYELVSVESAGCTGAASGSANVTIGGLVSGNLVAGSTAVCENQTAVLTFNFTGPTPYTFVYSENGIDQPAITAPNSSYNLTVTPTSTGNNLYELVSLEAGGCDGSVAGTYSVNVNAAPEGELAGDEVLCGPSAAQITFSSSGSGPFVYNYTANGVPQAPVNAAISPFNFTVNPSVPTTYALTGVSANGCAGTGSGSAEITFSTPLTATISGGGQICQNGNGIDLQITFAGDGPYTFVYKANTTNQPPITTTDNPYILTVNPIIGTNYSLVNVSNDDCAGTVSGTAFVFVFTPPTADLLPVTQEFCSPANLNLEVNLTGTGPFTLVYSVNGTAQAPVTTFDDPYFIPINITNTTTYELLSVNSPGCTGDANGTATVVVNHAPAYANVERTCDQAAGTYIVEFDVINGEAPYALVPSSFSGTFDQATGHFTSDPLPLTSFYSFTFTDGNNCGQITVSGNPTCNCTTNAGTVNLTPIEACVNEPATFVFNNNAVKDNNDTLRFILHTLPATPIGTILAWTSGNAFPFLPASMQVGTTYYISAIAGNVAPNGNVLLNDSCLSVSQGVPVVWDSMPSADFPANFDICAGQTANVDLLLSGNAPFTFTYALNGVTQPAVIGHNASNYTVSFTASQNTTVTLLALEDRVCSDGVLTGSTVVTVNSPPTISGLNTVCDLTTGTYTVQFSATGQTPFNVSGLAGTFAGNNFTSSPIPVADPFAFTLGDANGCGQVAQTGISNCGCATSAGTMNLNPITVCSSETAQATFNLDSTLVPGNVFKYVLHTLPGTTLGTVLSWLNAPTASFLPGMTPGTTYYLSAIAGNPDPATGNPSATDPCLSVSAGVPIVWNAPPTATLATPQVNACPGQAISIPVTLTGAGPFSLTYTNNGTPGTPLTFPAGSTSGTINLVPSQNTTIALSAVSSPGCTNGNVNGQTLVNIAAPPTISNAQTVCNPAAGTYILVFNINGTAPFTVTGVNGTVSGNSFVSSPLPILGGSYSASVRDANNCGAATLTGTPDCNCGSFAGMMLQDTLELCAGKVATGTQLGTPTGDANDRILYILHTAPGGNPIGNILAWSTAPTFPFIPGSMFPELTYYISCIVGDSSLNSLILITDPCLSVATGQPVIWHAAPTATLFSAQYDVCPGEEQQLTVFFTGTPTYNYTYNLNGVPTPATAAQNSVIITTTVLTNTTIQMLTVSDKNGCTGTATGTATIRVHPTPEIVNETVVCSPDNLSYTVEFDVINADLPSVVLTGVLGGNFDTQTGHFVSAPLPANVPYDAQVSDIYQCGMDSISGVSGCNCATFAGTMSLDTISLCSNDPVMAPLTTGPTLDPNDTLIYVISTTQGPPTWTILGTNNVPEFTFNPGLMNVGTLYYVLAVAGNNTPAGLDFGDACLSVAFGTPVRWNPPVSAFLTGNTEICQGDTADLQINFTGTAPFNFTYVTNSINPVTLVSPTNNYTLSVHPQFSANYSLTAVDAAGCTGTVSGGAALSVLLPPDLIDVEQTCDFVSQTFTLKFKIANGVAPNPVYSVNGLAGTLTDTVFTSNPIPFGTAVNLTVSNPIGCEKEFTWADNCVCVSNAGTLNLNPVTACVNGFATVQSNGDFVLETDDVLQYILYADPTQLPNGILATSTAPQFSFQSGMTPGTIYFVSAVVGNKVLPGGSIDLLDPCLSVSEPTTVVFNQGPSAVLAGDTSVCPGESVFFPVNFTGTGPFTFVYSINNVVNPPVVSPQNTFLISAVDVNQAQTFTLVNVENGTCPGLVMGNATVNVNEIPKASVSGEATVCPGKPATITINLSGATNFDVVLTDGTVLPGIKNNFNLEVTPSQTTTYGIASVTATGNGCPPEIGGSATITVADLFPTITATVQNGFNIGCNGGTDGSASITASGGTPPYTYLWSNTGVGPQQPNLHAGTYYVTVTDIKGCSKLDSIALTEPLPINFTWKAVGAPCFGDENGTLEVGGFSGGANPFTVTVDGVQQQANNGTPLIFKNLAPGTQTIEVEDANGCKTDATADIPEPEEITVQLGADLTIAFGDSVKLEGSTNATAIDTFFWSPTEYLGTPGNLTTFTYPFETMIYELTVVDTSGCSGKAEIRVDVERQRRIYVPTVIGLDAGTENQFFTIFAGAEVREINFLRIYDRWGELVFIGEDMAPNDITAGWDGYWKDRYVLPGVYVYVAEIEYIDGSTEILKGDVTAVR